MGRNCWSRRRPWSSVRLNTLNDTKPILTNWGYTRAIQYAKALNLKVLAIDGGEEKATLCTKLGADAVIDFMKTKVSAFPANHIIYKPILRIRIGHHCRSEPNNKWWCPWYPSHKLQPSSIRTSLDLCPQNRSIRLHWH